MENSYRLYIPVRIQDKRNNKNIFDLDCDNPDGFTGSDKRACKSRFANASSWMHLSLEKSVLGIKSPRWKMLFQYTGARNSRPAHHVCARVARFDELSYAITLPRLSQSASLSVRFKKGDSVVVPLDVPGCSFGESLSM